MRTEAAGELAHVLDRVTGALADNIRRAELFADCNTVGMVHEQDDLLGAAASRGDHTAQAYRAVADDGSRSTGSLPSPPQRPPCRHDV